MFGQTNIPIADPAFIDPPQGGANGTEAVLFVNKLNGHLSIKKPDGTTVELTAGGDPILMG